jgi:hypothetical protein
MSFNPLDPASWPVRLTTSEVLAIARFSRGTLLKRIDEGKMPAAVDRGGGGLLFDRDAVSKALGVVKDQPPEEPDPWKFNREEFRALMAKDKARSRGR